MKRAKKRGRRGAGPLGTAGALVIGGVTLGSTRPPPGSSRSSAGRLGRAKATAAKKSSPRAKNKPTTGKALERWDNEGGQPPKPAAASAAPSKRPMKKANTKTKTKTNSKTNSKTNTKTKSKRSAVLAQAPPNQRNANARLKDSQIKQAGFESRLLGHVSASGKRNQARRDSKNR